MQTEFKINDIVQLRDDANFFYNEYLKVEEKNEMKINVDYRIINIEIEEENEILYTLENTENNFICDVMVNEWEIEKSK